MLIKDMIKHHAKESPDNIAYYFDDQKTTYQEFDQLVQNFAGQLNKNGFKKGDRVALLLDNSPHFVIAYHGILRAGMVVVPVNPIYTPKEILFILLNSQASRSRRRVDC